MYQVQVKVTQNGNFIATNVNLPIRNCQNLTPGENLKGYIVVEGGKRFFFTTGRPVQPVKTPPVVKKQPSVVIARKGPNKGMLAIRSDGKIHFQQSKSLLCEL